jgi:ech hydrogenase subunit A
MPESILILIFIPLVFAVTLPFTSVRIRSLTTFVYVLFLVFISLRVALSSDPINITFSHHFHNAFIAIDLILLGYFVLQGFKYKQKLVSGLAILQIFLYLLLFQFMSLNNSFDIIVDDLSRIMLLVVNIVGGIIIIYALPYIHMEEMKTCKKGLFIGILFFFIGVMNFVVTTNNIELFFLTFELTTLCSYLLIRFRMDEIALHNALRALWMNQVGGIAILLSLLGSLYFYESIYFDKLLEVGASTYLLPIAFLVIAAMVKGASLPFEKWLLGAMVAPTPVSAILHSATMVKIAPYLVLKITPALSPTLSLAVILFGTFVFMSASLMALSKDFFKEVLGLSTIALLALMVAIAAIGTPEARNITLILIVFHALSKALLFLQAGILEKQFHLKYLSDINGLVSKSKLVVFFILIGFASLTLPPFGAFIGKFLTIQLLADLISTNIFFLLALVFILLGSVFLTLLYFKVMTKLLLVTPTVNEENASIPMIFLNTSFALTGLLFCGIYYVYHLGYISLVELLIPLVIFILSLILLKISSYKGAHRVKEYNCGEKDQVNIQAFYFTLRDRYLDYIRYISILAFITIIFIGAI